MASIQKRNKTFAVIYYHTTETGKRKQRWETYKTLHEAKQRKALIELGQDFLQLAKPIHTMQDLLDEYVEVYGRAHWSHSTYERTLRIIETHLTPTFGKLNLQYIDSRVINRYYHTLQTQPNAISSNTLHSIHKILRAACNCGVHWQCLAETPMRGVATPTLQPTPTAIWTPDELQIALAHCQDKPRLSLAIQLAFACSLRKGELQALTWDDIHWNTQSLTVDKTLARISKRSLDELPTQKIIFAFPPIQFAERTLTVLKKPKTKSSIRTVFIPQALLVQLRAFQEAQIQHIQTSSAQYRNYNLIFCNRSGTPLSDNLLSNQLLAVAQQANLSPVTFHSLRHSSITYKLLLSGGDIKSVQGDSGHSQSKMVTDVYAHILDKQRKTIAEAFNQTFYQNHTEKDFSQFVQLLTKHPSYKERLLKLLSEIPNA